MALRQILRRSFNNMPPEIKGADKVFSQIDQYLGSAPPPKATLMVLGPSKSGRSTLIDLVSANLVNVGVLRSELYSQFPASEYLSSKNEDVDYEQTIGVGTTFKSMFDAYDKLQPDNEIKTEFKELLYKHAKILSDGYAARELPAEATEEQKESIFKQDNTILNDINRKLDYYSKVIKIKSFSQSALEHIIDRVKVGDAVEIMHQSCIGLLIDRSFGEHSTALLVESLDLLGDICARDGYPNPVMRFDDSQLMYRTPMLSMYSDQLLKALQTSKNNFYSIVEGTGVYGESLRMLKNGEEAFQIAILDELTEEETYELINSHFEIKLSKEQKHQVWRISGGNQSLLYQLSEALQDKKMNLDSIESEVKSNAINSLSSKLLNYKLDEPGQDTSFRTKMIHVDFPELRAVMYFLFNLASEPSNSKKIPIEDASSNIILRELCMDKILFYNPTTETIKFDKKFLPDLLKQCELWSLTEGAGNRYKNKLAYERVLQESLEADN